MKATEYRKGEQVTWSLPWKGFGFPDNISWWDATTSLFLIDHGISLDRSFRGGPCQRSLSLGIRKGGSLL